MIEVVVVREREGKQKEKVAGYPFSDRILTAIPLFFFQRTTPFPPLSTR